MKRLNWMVGGVFAAWFSACSCGPTIVKVTGPTLPTHADGMTPAAITATITSGGSPVARGTMTLTTTAGDWTPIPDPTMPPPPGQSSSPTLVNGTASASLYSVTAGTMAITAVWTDPSSGSSVSGTGTVVFGSTASPTIATITFVSAVPASIGLKGSGNETSKVTFLCKDNQGNPVPAGASVTFSLPSPNNLGATISPMTANTDSAGTAYTNLTASTVAGTIVVTASAGASVTGQSNPITIVGGLPSYENFTFTCDSPSMAGLDPAFAQVSQNCTTKVSDRNSNKLNGVQITFHSEAGSVDPFATTDATGTAVMNFGAGNPNPKLVAASTADFDPLQCLLPTSFAPDFLNCPFHWTPPLAEPTFTSPTGVVANPRQGVVTLIAFTTGAEACYGQVVNGACMCGTSPCPVCAANANTACFTDLPEPFLDENDNGTWDPGEYFDDTNNNGTWDPANGQWDAQIEIWRSFRVVWASGPVFGPKYSEILNAAGQALNGLPPIGPCGSAPVKFRFIDLNGNAPAAALAGSTDSISSTASGAAAVTGPVGGIATANMMGWGYYSATINATNCGTPASPPTVSSVTFSFAGSVAPGGAQNTYTMTLNGSY
jgi:hypothetical protein